jgi:hypothetical protein
MVASSKREVDLLGGMLLRLLAAPVVARRRLRVSVSGDLAPVLTHMPEYVSI